MNRNYQQIMSTSPTGHPALWAVNVTTMSSAQGTRVLTGIPAQHAEEPKNPVVNRLEGPERDRLLLEHLPSVRYIAHRIHERLPQHVELDDLISAGVVGLIDAYNKFDHTKKVQFKSYAQFRIRGAILDSLRILDWSPRELRRKGRAVQEAVQSMTRRLRRTPTEPEIAHELNLGLNEYQLLLGQLKGLEIGSLNLEHKDDSGEDQLAYIAGSPEDDPLFRCLQGAHGPHLVLLRGIDDERDRPHPWRGRIAHLADPFCRHRSTSFRSGKRKRNADGASDDKAHTHQSC